MKLNNIFCFYSKVFHVRPVTQGDVIRADTKEIPRIFQLLYAGEGEARRPDDPNQQDLNTLKGSADERPGIIIFKGKIFVMKYMLLTMKHNAFL